MKFLEKRSITSKRIPGFFNLFAWLLAQAEAKRAKLTAAAKEGAGNNGLPVSRSEQLSDAKLFQVTSVERHALVISY